MKALEAKLSQRRTLIEVKLPSGETRNVGRQHREVPTLLALVGQNESVFMVGPAGSFKTSAAKAVATALNLPFYCESMSQQTSISQLLGYMDAHGRYVRSKLREAYEHGGVYLMDEIDNGNARDIHRLSGPNRDHRKAHGSADDADAHFRHYEARLHEEGIQFLNEELKDASQEKQQKKTQVELLLEIAGELKLFKTPDGEGFCTITVKKHKEHHAIRGEATKQWLSNKFRKKHKKPPHDAAVKNAIASLESKAIFEGEESAVYVRVAEHNGNVYLDLANETWQAIKITPTGWQIVNEPPVKFRRPKGLQRLPNPVHDGDLNALRPFVNVDDDNWILLSGWMIGATRWKAPFPILEFRGNRARRSPRYPRSFGPSWTRTQLLFVQNRRRSGIL